MNPKQLFYILVFGCLASTLGIGGTFYVGNTLLQKQSSRLLDKKTDLAAIEEEEKTLAQAKKDIEKYKDVNQIAKAIVPQDKDQAKTVRELLLNANKSATPVQSVIFASSTLGQKITATPATTSSTEAGTNMAAQKATQTPPVTQAKPVTGINGIYSMQIDVANDSQHTTSYESFIGFLRNLENNRRTANITNISITPDQKSPKQISYTVSVEVYIKPEVKK